MKILPRCEIPATVIVMIRNASLLLALALMGFGCASQSEYGMETSPVVQEMDDQSDSESLGEKITEDNLEAQEDGDAPIFNYDDNGSPE
ncbi:hypothetical protein [Puniceicoccus vermicola]|uniref:Uncharacterized protein n=1 Tax=Puniceicoccus vermicola TaxID=388746 RepID=A0A7X1E6G7_9BACT|nr:hypothetical protein [Puniceicoccus vermicola]MBC2604083.1 hypothetical protein [Puniceicoccus vermicola]